MVVDEGQDHDTCWHAEINSLPAESGGWWHIYQLLLRQFRESPAGIFYDAAQRPLLWRVTLCLVFREQVIG